MNRKYPKLVELFAELSYDNERVMADVIEEHLSMMDETIRKNLVLGDEHQQRLAMNVFRRTFRSADYGDLAASCLDNILTAAF